MLQLCIALTHHKAPLSPAAAPVVPDLGLWEKCEPGLWQRSPSAQDKLQCKLQWNQGNRSSWRMYSLFSQLLLILTHYTSAPPACLMLSENFSILEDWSSSNIRIIETSTLIQNNPPIPWKPRLKTILFIHFHNHICIRRPIFSLKFETCG